MNLPGAVIPRESIMYTLQKKVVLGNKNSLSTLYLSTKKLEDLKFQAQDRLVHHLMPKKSDPCWFNLESEEISQHIFGAESSGVGWQWLGLSFWGGRGQCLKSVHSIPVHSLWCFSNVRLAHEVWPGLTQPHSRISWDWLLLSGLCCISNTLVICLSNRCSLFLRLVVTPLNTVWKYYGVCLSFTQLLSAPELNIPAEITEQRAIH